MKYENKRKGIKFSQNDVYLFSIGKEELQLFKDIFNHYKKSIPRTVDTTQTLSRIQNFLKVLNSIK